MRNLRSIIITATLIGCSVWKATAKEHPCLLLTSKGANEIKASLGKYPVFDSSFDNVRRQADQALQSTITLPQPVDGGGGYSHEKHKSNYYEMFYCGTMYQVTKEKKYAQFVRRMLLEYAQMYPTLDLHPAKKSATPGRIFWQNLNECVWLVHTANAYDCVHDFIPSAERTKIEENLFRPMAKFISEGNKENIKTFNKMHNHATWATASVGMIGYVMNDKDLIDKALYGLDKSGKGGFLRQMEELFSPDGYFTEGAYYQRYAIWPFVTFAQVIQNNQPELKIFERRNKIFSKAVNVLIQLSYNGQIMRFNDALYKTLGSQEIVNAVDIVYYNDPTQKGLLDIALQQDLYIVSDAGIYTAKAVATHESRPFIYRSMLLHDGPKGDNGAIAVLRQNDSTGSNSVLTFKATSHGLSHGHYDKLTFLYYDNGNEILQDYGAARFLNYEPKYAGHYTKENRSFVMQTIAHNTVTVDGNSHYNGNYNLSMQHAPTIHLYEEKAKIKVVSAIDSTATPGVRMQRTMVLFENEAFEHPAIIDILKLESTKKHTYDLPFYYIGIPGYTNFNMPRQHSELRPLGERNGYQHLWKEAQGQSEKSNIIFSWINKNRFYTLTSLNNSQQEAFFVRIGANDPNFNLRNDAAYLLRQKETGNHTFVNTIEAHGTYDMVWEITSGYKSAIKELTTLLDNESYTIVQLKMQSGKSLVFALSNRNNSSNATHKVKTAIGEISWIGGWNLSEK